jgi:hypothetical protein
MREYNIADVRRPGPDDSAAAREAPRPHVNRGDNRRPEEPKAEAAPADEGKRRHYPHQKAPKNLSTEQFFEKMHADGESLRKRPDRPRKERAPRSDKAPEAAQTSNKPEVKQDVAET